MIRFSSWAVGLVVCTASLSAFAEEGDPVTEPAPASEPAPAAASAEGSVATSDGAGDEKKFQLALRLGYALPLGDVSDGSKLSDGTSGQLPIWIDAGYLVTPNILVGVYGQYGIVFVKDCPSGASCSGHDIRLGVQGQYHISPQQSVDPWFGLGFGYEIFGASQSANGQSADLTVKGFEFLNLQGGADFRVGSAFSIGPFVALSLGKYSTAKVTSPFGDVDGDIEKTAMHEWLTLGLKGTLGI